MTTIGVLAALCLLFVPYAPIQWASAFVLAVTGGSWLYAETLRLNVEITRRTPTIRMFRHEDAEQRLSVRNTGFLPVPMLLLSDSCGELYTKDDSAFVLSVPARSTRTLRYRLRAHYRGIYPTGPIRMRMADPLGLFPIVRELPAPGRIIVYPRYRHMQLPRKLGVPVGTTRVGTPRAADTTRYRSLRDYVAGDDTRHIGWKATARHGTLKTREFTPTIDAPLVVFLNLSTRYYADRHRMLSVERSVETAASLVMAAASGRRSFRLRVYGNLGELPYNEVRGSGDVSALHALELLARARVTTQPAALEELLATVAPSGTAERLCYVGPVLPDEEVDRLLTGGLEAGRVELYYVQELSRRANVRMNPQGMAVHIVRLFGDIDGEA
jgi:uncharacterized protein (DUF58 family)